MKENWGLKYVLHRCFVIVGQKTTVICSHFTKYRSKMIIHQYFFWTAMIKTGGNGGSIWSKLQSDWCKYKWSSWILKNIYIHSFERMQISDHRSKIQVYQLLYILDVLATNYTNQYVLLVLFWMDAPSHVCPSNLQSVYDQRFRSTRSLCVSTCTADGRSRPRLLPPSRRCAGRVWLRSSKYWWDH